MFVFPPGERGVYEGSAQDLYGFRKQNAMAFEQEFAGRLIDLSGNVSAVHPDAIVMLNGDAAPWTVKCRFDPNDKDATAALAKLKVGDPVRILGRYRGKEHWRSPSGFLDLDDCELVSP
ncbi:MAG TPA: hypothetical protein PKC18_05385 [Lacipirellulaceae bacterium]|nr:hypothetical protein [Lacipirellulaceae bacterium]